MTINAQSEAERIASLFKEACLAELTALKPGNVHIFADGHGMVVQDFIKSAEVTSAVIAQPGLSVGERILLSIRATREAVGCNTNLGIVLLAAPLIQAALLNNLPNHGVKPSLENKTSFESKTGLEYKASLEAKVNLEAALKRVLSQLTIQDAIDTYQAIQIASPGGLGSAEQHDVHAIPDVSLLSAMQAAQDRDRIAHQYAAEYSDILNVGLHRYQQALQAWRQPIWAATAVYLNFMASFNDSHVERKFSKAIADGLRAEAGTHAQQLSQLENPKLYQKALLQWDADLKARGLNPGTSADLTVATLFSASLMGDCG